MYSFRRVTNSVANDFDVKDDLSATMTVNGFMTLRLYILLEYLSF